MKRRKARKREKQTISMNITARQNIVNKATKSASDIPSRCNKIVERFIFYWFFVLNALITAFFIRLYVKKMPCGNASELKPLNSFYAGTPRSIAQALTHSKSPYNATVVMTSPFLLNSVTSRIRNHRQ